MSDVKIDETLDEAQRLFTKAQSIVSRSCTALSKKVATGGYVAVHHSRLKYLEELEAAAKACTATATMSRQYDLRGEDRYNGKRYVVRRSEGTELYRVLMKGNRKVNSEGGFLASD